MSEFSPVSPWHFWWSLIGEQLSADLPDAHSLVRVTLRLLFALLFSAAIGWQRESVGKAAGLRTHMLVGLGSALFVAALGEAGATAGDLTRVTQGVATGIGFIGGGVILKLESEKRVKGLTTAATVWLTAAVGIAAGVGRLGAAMVGLALCLLVLIFLQRVEPRERRKRNEERNEAMAAAARRRTDQRNVTYGVDADSADDDED